MPECEVSYVEWPNNYANQANNVDETVHGADKCGKTAENEEEGPKCVGHLQVRDDTISEDTIVEDEVADSLFKFQ